MIPPMDNFTAAYIEAALWSSNDESDESGGQPLGSNYGVEDIAPDTLLQMIADCTKFQREMNSALHSGEATDSQAGHDFWLTRGGHGAGFWDRGGLYESFADDPGVTPNAETLTAASEKFGGIDLYVGDDGMIYS